MCWNCFVVVDVKCSDVPVKFGNRIIACLFSRECLVCLV